MRIRITYPESWPPSHRPQPSVKLHHVRRLGLCALDSLLLRIEQAALGGLHSKVYVIDRRDVIIGSFNFDPRSVHLNTELALVVHNPALAAQVLEKVEKGMSPQESFHLICDKYRLFWLSSEDNWEIRYRHQPKATLWRHMKAVACSLLPLEEQL